MSEQSFDDFAREDIIEAYGTGDGIGLLKAALRILQYYNPSDSEVWVISEEIRRRIMAYLLEWTQPPTVHFKLVDFKAKPVRTLDQAFGVSRPKNWTPPKKHRPTPEGKSVPWELYQAVLQYRTKHPRASKALAMKKVCKPLGLSYPTARRWLRDVEKTLERQRKERASAHDSPEL